MMQVSRQKSIVKIICAICTKNKPKLSDNLTVVSLRKEEYHHRRDIIGKLNSEEPLALCKMYRYILSEQAKHASIGYRIHVEGEQKI